MDEKKAYEAFRVRKFAQPHPASMLQRNGVTADTDVLDSEPDSEHEPHMEAMHADGQPLPAGYAGAPSVEGQEKRVILHFDCDCFYAQVEEVRNPALREVPLGVTQKYLIVTCNYPARAAGVTKLMGIRDAQARCPGLVLVSGEDLTPYRQASKAIHAVLSRYGPAERLGMDETYVDCTAEVLRRIRSGAFEPPAPPPRLVGHRHTAACAVGADTRYRPQDLRARPPAAAAGAAVGGGEDGGGGGDGEGNAVGREGAGAGAGGGAATGGTGVALAGDFDGAKDAQGPAAGPAHSGLALEESWGTLLAVGSMVAAEARAAVRAETGFRSSAGIAPNKLLAKLVSGLHKPDDQTTIHPDQAADFVATLPVRALTGVGYKTERMLAERLGAGSAADVRRCGRQRLAEQLGDKTASLLWQLAWGCDPSPVRPSGPPRSITVEDSFRSCASRGAAAAVLRVLAPDLLARLREEWAENRRRPETLTLKWRHRGTGWARTSASCPMPLQPGTLGTAATEQQLEAQAEALVRAALSLLQRHLREPFNLSLINLGAANFKQEGTGGGGGGGGGGGTILELLSRGRGDRPCDGGGTAAAAAGGSGAGPLRDAAAAGPSAAPPPLSRRASARGGDCGFSSGEERLTDEDGQMSGEEEDEEEHGDSGFGLRESRHGAQGVGGHVASPMALRARPHASSPHVRAGRAVGSSSGCGGGGAGIGGLSPSQARAARRAAETSATLRRDYSSAGAGVLSKSRERELREAAARAQLAAVSGALGRGGGGSGGGTRGGGAERYQQQSVSSMAALPPPGPRPFPMPKPAAMASAAAPPAAHPVPPSASAVTITQHVAGVAMPRAPSPAGVSVVSTLPSAPAAASLPARRSTTPDAGADAADGTDLGLASEQVTGGGCPPVKRRRMDNAAAANPEFLPAPWTLGPETPPTDCPQDLDPAVWLDPAVLSYRIVELHDRRTPHRTCTDGCAADGDGATAGDDDGVDEEQDGWRSEGYSSSDGGGLDCQPGGYGGRSGDWSHWSWRPLDGEVQDAELPGGDGRRLGEAEVGDADARVRGLGVGAARSDGVGAPLAGALGSGPGPPAATTATGAVEAGLHEGPTMAPAVQQQPALEPNPQPQPPAAPPAERQRQQHPSHLQQPQHLLPSSPSPAPHRCPLPAHLPAQHQRAPPSAAPTAPPAGVSLPRPAWAAPPPPQRVMLHVDVDCFYCQVERMDDPGLVGVPLAVTQFNSGGFVAVSYEARAAGIRCGDGVGAGGRASLPHLRAMGAVSLAEARRRCPGLAVRPMRTERYRQVAERVHGLLRSFAPDGQVEKTSYDDFYLDVTQHCSGDRDAREEEEGSRGGEHPDRGRQAGAQPPHAQRQGQSPGPPGPAACDGHAPEPIPDLGLGLDSEGDAEGLLEYVDEGCGELSEEEDPHPTDWDDWQQQERLWTGLDIGRAAAAGAADSAAAERGTGGGGGDGVSASGDVGRASGGGQRSDGDGDGGGSGAAAGDGGSPPPRVHVAGGAGWGEVEPALRRGVAVAQRLRAALRESLSMTVSVGVAPTKLSARLVGPTHKPDAVTVLPAARVRDFMAGVRLQSVPGLAGKTGARVVSELGGRDRVGDLATWTRAALASQFGPQLGAFLADLPLGGPDAGAGYRRGGGGAAAAAAGAGGGGSGGGGGGGTVRERGPQKSILVERSFPAITRFGGVKEALVPLVGTLWGRLVEDAVRHSRAPSKLLLTWRQGYGAPKTRSANVSVQVLQALKAAVAAAGGAGSAATCAVAAAASPAPARPGAVGATSPAVATSPAAPALEASPNTSRGATAPNTSATGGIVSPTAHSAAAAFAPAAGASPAACRLPPAASIAAGAASAPASAAASVAAAADPASRWQEPGAVPGHTYQGCRVLLEGAAAIFKTALGNTRNGMQITRLAVAVSFGAAEAGEAAGQRPISAFAVQQLPAAGRPSLTSASSVPPAPAAPPSAAVATAAMPPPAIRSHTVAANTACVMPGRGQPAGTGVRGATAAAACRGPQERGRLAEGREVQPLLSGANASLAGVQRPAGDSEVVPDAEGWDFSFVDDIS